MNLEDLKKHLAKAIEDNTLMTAKHDPNNLSTTFNSYRTVLSSNLADNLAEFISSDEYTVIEYENTKLPTAPLYFEIIPFETSDFKVPASGVTSNSITASTIVDRLVAVSGATNGWHLFGEDSSVINRKIENGDLNKKGGLS